MVIEYWCNEGFIPSDIMTSVCSYRGLWTPLPQAHNCILLTGRTCILKTTFYRSLLAILPISDSSYCMNESMSLLCLLASLNNNFACTIVLSHDVDVDHAYAAGSATISPPLRTVSRGDIDCPGDTISYNCSIQSNGNVHLTWHVTLPGLMPANITYDNSSEPNIEEILHPFPFITTVLREYRSGEHILLSTLTLTVQNDVPTDGTTLACYIGQLSHDSVIVIVNTSGKNIARLSALNNYILHGCRSKQQCLSCSTAFCVARMV